MGTHSSLEITKELPESQVSIGVIAVRNLSTDAVPEGFDALLASLLQRRREELDEQEEAIRKQVRDALRHGAYKPTGRAKPSSEYLLRAARQEQFPRINGVVDLINYMSLRYMIPISLWDLQLAGTDRYHFRYGTDGESYVFNPSGQTIELKDMVTGFACDEHRHTPIVNPVKDSMATKTTPESRTAAAAVYFPIEAVGPEDRRQIMDEFAGFFSQMALDAPQIDMV